MTGLTTFTTSYLRAGAINWNNVVNYVTFGSTRTDAGVAITGSHITQVYVSSLTATWVALPGGSGNTGYVLEASLTDFGAVVASSITTDVALSTLSFNIGTLNPDTTYFVRVGALYNGATTYATPSLSTSTLTNLLTPSVLSVSSRTVTAGWPAFDTGS